MAMHTPETALQAALEELKKGNKEFAINFVRVALALLTDSEIPQDLAERDSINLI